MSERPAANDAAGEMKMDKDVRTTRQDGRATIAAAAVCAALLALLPPAATLAAQDRPAGLEAESRPVTASRPAAVSPEDRPIGGGALSDQNSGLKLVAALLVVVAALLVLRSLVRRSRRLSGAGDAAGPLEAVASLRLSPTHQVRLVRLGRRLIVVGLTGQSMATLAEVSDPREIADLLERAGVKQSPTRAPVPTEPGTDYLHDTTTREKPPTSRKGEGL